MDTLHRELIDCTNTRVSIDSTNPVTLFHFSRAENFADVVIGQFNNERFYDEYLKDKKDLVVLDLGANIGLFSIYAYPCAKKIIAVEPAARHVLILRDLLKNYPNVTIVPAAVYHSDGVVEISCPVGNTTMTSVVNNYGNTERVTAVTLRKLMEDNDLSFIDFIKCDIEGGEMALFTDDVVSYSVGKVHEWYIEVHPTGTDMEFNIKYIMDLFRAHGYETKRLRWDAIHCVEVKA